MMKRLFGAALLALALAVAAAPPPAVAVEGGDAEVLEEGVEGGAVEQRPSIDEIGTDTARSEGFFPEEYVAPTWFQWVLYPVLGIGVLMALGLLLYYLAKQPSFARERREKTRSR